MKTTLQPFLDMPGTIYKARLLQPGQLPCLNERGTYLDLGEKTYWVSLEAKEPVMDITKSPRQRQVDACLEALH